MKEYLLFDVGDHKLGLNVSHVQQVVRAATLSDTVSASSAIEGLLNLRGEVVPVMSLKNSLGIDQPPLSDTDYLIIVRHGSDPVLAIRSNSDVQLTVAEETAKSDQATNSHKTEGVIRVDGQLISLLNPAALSSELPQQTDGTPGGTRG